MSFSGRKPTSEFTRGLSSFLKPLRLQELRLFGERRSKIIDELILARKELCEPFDYEAYEANKTKSETAGDQEGKKAAAEEGPKDKDAIWNEGYLLSIPYDANIGFFVYRNDLLAHIKGQLDVRHVKEELGTLLKNEANLVLRSLKKEKELEKELRKSRSYEIYSLLKEYDPDNAPEISDEKEKCRIAIISRMIDYVAKRVAFGKPPRTWEEMIVLTKLCEKKIMLETQSFDSYVSTFLEVLWNCGAESLRVLPDYTFDGLSEDDLKVSLLKAFHIFKVIFECGVADRDSTLETRGPERIPTIRADYADPDKWLFARHWYSTLVQNLTSKDNTGKYFWCDSHPMDLEIMPVPASLSNWIIDVIETSEEQKANITHFLNCEELHICEDIRQCENIKQCFFQNRFPKPCHHSCWGNRDFALLNGSENESLGFDVINNMMSSEKIVDRAFSCACIPTVEDFYRMYGDSQCLGISERPEIDLPKLTYNELRELFFKEARTRLNIYDFRHFGKSLRAKLEIIRKSKWRSVDNYDSLFVTTEDLLSSMCDDLIADIRRLSKRPILIKRSDSFLKSKPRQ